MYRLNNLFENTYENNAIVQNTLNYYFINEIYCYIKRNFKPKSNIKILDLCCGHGYPTFLLYEKLSPEYNVFIKGLDISKELINIANSKYKNQNLTFENLDVKKLNNVNEYNIIISLFGLHWIQDLSKISKKIYIALQDKGHFISYIPLEKKDLFKLRSDYFKNFLIENNISQKLLQPCRYSYNQYSKFFDKFFDVKRHGVLKCTFDFEKNNYIKYLESWTEEIRFLKKYNFDTNKYLINLVKYIEKNIKSLNLKNTNICFNEKINFNEIVYLYYGVKR